MKDCKKMTSHKIELETEIKDSKKNKGLQRLIWNELKKMILLSSGGSFQSWGVLMEKDVQIWI